MSQFVAWFRSDWAGLFILAMATLIRGVTYLPTFTQGEHLPSIDRWMSTAQAAVLWMAIGTAGLIAFAVHRAGATFVGLCSGMHFLWALLYIFSWFVGDTPRGLSSGLLYTLPTLLVIWAFARRPVSQVEVIEVGRG